MLIVTLALLGLAAITVGNALRESRASGGPSFEPEERVVAANLLALTPAAIAPRITAYGKVEAERTLELRLRQGGTVAWVSDSLRNGGTASNACRAPEPDPLAMSFTGGDAIGADGHCLAGDQPLHLIGRSVAERTVVDYIAILFCHVYPG
ncbi:MAG: hypothetical protein NTW20_02480 [Rhodobacterales bacterium]|nr:hypothetical protein [Rhodobacterales bacterium]